MDSLPCWRPSSFVRLRHGDVDLSMMIESIGRQINRMDRVNRLSLRVLMTVGSLERVLLKSVLEEVAAFK
ncbi:hypothetical protein TNCV_2387951 [Trichonephila clavipes]|nr:hypothetical protein TNCV_2387951 [Trichonephila clavipes]